MTWSYRLLSPILVGQLMLVLLTMVNNGTAQERKAQERKAPEGKTQGRKGPSRPTSKHKRPRAGAGVTAEQAAAVNALVREHHPALATLLAQLKESRPGQYTQAVRALFRTSVRLASIQERDMEKYDLELKRWKLESQTQLLALKAARSGDAPDLVADLHEVAEELLNARIALMELEWRRQKERLERLDEQLQSLRTEPDKQVEADVQALLRSARALTKSQSKKPTPSVKVNVTKPNGKTKQSKQKQN